jgi:hypothetical protein
MSFAHEDNTNGANHRRQRGHSLSPCEPAFPARAKRHPC